MRNPRRAAKLIGNQDGFVIESVGWSILSDAAGSGVVAASSGAAIKLVMVVAATIGISFFCSICEAALYAVSSARVEQLAQSGSVSGKRLQRLRKSIDKPIAAILALNTIANTAGATFSGMLAAEVFDSVGVGVFSGFLTLGILFVSEIIPKTVGVLHADRVAPFLSAPIDLIIRVLWPLVALCQFVTRTIAGDASAIGTVTEEELLALSRLSHRSGTLTADEARWMQNALKLDQINVADILTPRTVIQSMPKDATVGEASQTALSWPHKRLPLTDGSNVDEIVGVAIREDILHAASAGENEKTLDQLKRPASFVPKTMKVSDLLSKALRERTHLFIVVDEYGGTAGIVTLEDAIETLLGSEIVDETDAATDLRRLAKQQGAEKLKNIQQENANIEPPPGA